MYHINKEITGSGENIALKNSAKHYFKDFQIFGNSKQETRQGYNLFDANLIASRDDTENSGVVLTNNKDGSFTIKSTETVAKMFTATATYSTEVSRKLFKAGTVYIKQDKTNIAPYPFLSFRHTSGTYGEVSYSSNNTKFELTQEMIDSEGFYVRFGFYAATNATGVNYTCKPMVYQDGDGTFELFGASPSIEYEAPIKSVGDNIQLFDVSTVTTNKFVYADSGYLGDSTVSITSDYIPVVANETYIALLDYETLAQDGPRGITLYDNDKKYISGVTYTSSKKGFTFTPTQSGYLRFSYDNNCTTIKLSKGKSTGAYSPYGQGSIEIYNCNENFWEINNTSFTPTAVSWHDFNGVSNMYNNSQYNKSTAKIKLKAGNYYMSYGELINIGTVQIIKIDGSTNGVVLSTGKGAFELTEDSEILIRLSVTTANVKTSISNVHITSGTEEKEYIEHQSQTKVLYIQQPFRAIGDVKDRFVKQDGVWYEEHSVYRRIFDGTETFSKSVSNGFIRYSVTLNDIKSYNDEARHIDRILCSHFEASTLNGYNRFFQYKSSIFFMANFETIDEFKAKLTELYNAGTPLYIDYVLAQPTLIECTVAQVKQLESLEKEFYSYDEQTNIYSIDTISPYFEVTAYQRISEEFKTRLKEGKITRGYLKVLANDIYPEIIIDENNYLKDLKIEELRYVPEEGFIGGTVAKRVSGNFNNVDSSFNIQDREIEVYLGVELEDETTEYINYGTYIVQRPEDDQVNDNTSFEALDYMIKFNQEYKDRIIYPCTLKELLDDITDQAGVNSKVATFANSDFIVENNQFEQGSTLRDVLKAITQMAFNWSRIDADDNLVMDFQIRDTVDEELAPDDYFNYTKSDYYGPINTLILRNSQVEGENITIKDKDSINTPITKNMCPNDWVLGQYNQGDGQIGIYQNRIRLKDFLEVAPNTEYYLNTFNENYQIIIRTYLKDKTFSRSIGTLTPFMTNSEEYYIGVTIYSATDTTSNLLELIHNNIIKPFICLNSEQDKSYIPFKNIGEIEYVISDNPFAYTQEKRAELIEAGRKLFGLKYTPMNMDMIGFMYLNATDRIAATNLNGETFYTYLLNHTIDYTGVVLDSMESPAKTKTETKYQFTPQMIQLLKHTEIKVDKANQEISLVAEKQEGLESTVAEQKISLEEIRTGLTKVEEVVERTVARVEVVYALSDSPTKAPTSGWSTTAPEWVEGKYMWQKTITTYSDGSSSETAATNISGAQGKDGISGINGANSYSYVAFANSADGSKDFSRTDSTDKTYIGTLTINESVNENLLKKTNQGTTRWTYALQNGTKTVEAYEEDGVNGVKLTCTVASTGWQYAAFAIDLATLQRLKENTSYILSFDIQSNIGARSVGVALKRGDSTNTMANEVKADILGDETWEHFSVQLKTIADFSTITLGSQVVYITGLNKVGYYIIKNPKLEEGYRETSYSKSPEDLADDYTQYYWQYTKGEEGVGVKSVVDQYYLSTSNTEQTGGEWKETQDALSEGKYIWTRTKITWTNDSVTYTDPILANIFNDINSNIILLQEFEANQQITNQSITSSVSEVTKTLTNDYLKAEQVNSQINGINEDYEILEKRVASTELNSEQFKIQIDNINNNGVDKITTSMGYTFNDNGLNINRDNADTGTIVDEAGIQVIDKTGSTETDILYAGYIKEGNTKYADYVGQTIVATSNLIVKNFLVIGSNSRFQDYINPTLGGQGTGAFDI